MKEQINVLFTYVKSDFWNLLDVLAGHDVAEDVAVGRMLEGESVQLVQHGRCFVMDLVAGRE